MLILKIYFVFTLNFTTIKMHAAILAPGYQGISATTACSLSHNDDSLQLFWILPNRLVIRFTPVTTHTETTTQYESPFYTLDTLSLTCSSLTRLCARARPAVGGSEFSISRVLVISLLAHRHIDVPLACKRQYVIIRVDFAGGLG
jgi:hypothetical protein